MNNQPEQSLIKDLDVIQKSMMKSNVQNRNLKNSENKLDSIPKLDVNPLIREDSYYKIFETPLKPASAFKREHVKRLNELISLKEIRAKIDKSFELLLNPSLIEEQFNKIKNEIDQSADNYIHFAESENKDAKPIILQEMFGFSDETLLKIYEIATDLTIKNNYQDANALFTFLTLLAPHVSCYWIAQGVTLQGLNLHEESITSFDAAKFLDPSDPAPLAYSIESLMALKDNINAKAELELLKEIIKTLNKEEKKIWDQKIKELSF